MKSILAILALLLISGCDTLYGVSRRATIGTCPPPKQVEKLLYSLPEITDVKYSRHEGGRPLTIKGIQSPDIVHNYHYSGAINIHGTLQFMVDHQNTVSYSQTLLGLNHRPPQEWIDATVPVMEKIEQLIESEFGITNLTEESEFWEHM